MTFSDSGNETPLSLAVLSSFEGESPPPREEKDLLIKTLDLLIKHGANINHIDSIGISPLAWSVGGYSETNKELYKYFLEKKANVNTQDIFGYTPLHRAAEYGFEEVVKALIENKADPTARNKQNQTPRDIALKKGFINIAKYLEASEHK
jgi:ankyrin repeat protein